MYTASCHLFSKVAIAEPKQSMDHPRYFRDCWYHRWCVQVCWSSKYWRVILFSVFFFF